MSFIVEAKYNPSPTHRGIKQLLRIGTFSTLKAARNFVDKNDIPNWHIVQLMPRKDVERNKRGILDLLQHTTTGD